MTYDPDILGCRIWPFSIAFFLQYANSAIRPMIYFGFSDSYRKSLVSTFKPLLNWKNKKADNALMNKDERLKVSQAQHTTSTI